MHFVGLICPEIIIFIFIAQSLTVVGDRNVQLVNTFAHLAKIAKVCL